MEKVKCEVHDGLCMLKTGVKEGPNKGKSFYVCVDKQGCEFMQQASVPPSHCLIHEDSMVELQALTHSKQQLFYRCILGKKAGQRWCGSVPWTESDKEKRAPLSDTQLQPSCLPPVRNPFKAPGKTDEDSDWRKMQCGGGDEKGRKEEDGVANHKAEGRGNCQKEKVESIGAAVEGEKLNSWNTYRDKQLPNGMKIKTRLSDEERRSCQANSVETKTDKVQDSNNKNYTKQEEAEKPAVTQADPSVQESGSKSSPSSSSTRASRDSGNTSDLTASKLQESIHTKTLQDDDDNDDDDDDDDVVLLSVKPAIQKTPHVAAVQKTLTSFQGFQTASTVNVAALPDKGERLKTQVKELEEALDSLSLSGASQPGDSFHYTILFLCSASSEFQPFYGGRMTDDRLLAVKNATCEAIDHLHKSLESCPSPEADTADPKGIKVPLLAHQRRALAWLLWREAQKPCGGILADDMGLGKTLTMISLILIQKIRGREDEEKKEEKKLEKWISKTDSSLVVSKGTLIICPASLIHHWKKEIERHVKTGKLSVYLYHGPNRDKRAKVLADYDVVVTTYSLVSKEIPVQKEAPSCSGPLLRVAWARVVLDEAHNIKNPKVQTSMAVCRLRARARWAVTGTPIQNNLLDMYSLLKFLRCSPFDEYKLWKAQVDNGSKRGQERLNILTRSLLLRRTKDQLDSTGKPLVSLPSRTCEVHQLKLSEDEQAVYDVVFAQSRSTLQNYLKRHEEKDVVKGTSGSNPFEKVAQEFGISQAEPALSSSQQPQQASSTVHILSLLLRLRQCCCHLSLLKKTLDSSELQGDGIILSLEEQLNALSLSSSPSPSGPDPKDTVALNGSRFSSQLFEDTTESTKISAIVSELNVIRQKGSDQKSVIVSQWTSMLHIVAVHLKRMGLRYDVINGTVNPKRRMDLVEEFNTNPEGPQVMLVSLCAGGVGLNLIGGNHLFLIDMHWNPALEDQACDRIYRVGQRKDVTIHRFVCEGTVEEKISTLQLKKKELAQNVLSGTGSAFTKLSLADLKIIFGV
uniref:Transcription termination factor 2 n=1 Tax=Mastacembelus armatus TaxID=205130 RepID=A0A7N9AQC7_9TELE